MGTYRTVHNCNERGYRGDLVVGGTLKRLDNGGIVGSEINHERDANTIYEFLESEVPSGTVKALQRKLRELRID